MEQVWNFVEQNGNLMAHVGIFMEQVWKFKEHTKNLIELTMVKTVKNSTKISTKHDYKEV